MPNPSTSIATLRPEIAGSFTEFDLAMDRLGFIGHQVLPVLEVAAASGIFGKIKLEQLLQNNITKRASGSGYSRGDWDFTSDSFATDENGWEEPVDDREREIYANFFDAEMIAAQRAMDMVLRNAERRIAALVFNTTTFTPTTITNEWDDFTNAVPITDVNARRKAFFEATGLEANALIVNEQVFRNLRQCDQITDNIASSGAGDSIVQGRISKQQLAQAFDLPNILVAGSAQNTANENQTRSISRIWSDEYAMVTRVAETQDIQEPCLGRTFHYGADGSDVGGTVESYRDEPVRSDIIRVRHDTHEKILYTAMGQLLDNVTT